LIVATSALDRRESAPRATVETLRFLLDRGADPNGRGWLGRTPVHSAASAGDVAALQLLCERGGDVHYVAESNYTVLIQAAYRPRSARKYETLRWLSNERPASNVITDYRESPLSVCALMGDWEAIRMLLDAGEDAAPLQWTSLHQAVALGRIADVERELAKEFDREARDRWHQTALLLAIKCGDLAKAELLLDAGFELNTKGRCGKTPLQTAAAQDHSAMIAWLLDKGVALEDSDDFKRTALMAAAENDALGAVDTLLERGADPDARNQVESLAIHDASSIAVIKRLLQARPEQVNAIDGCGEWPLKDAASRNDVEAIDELCSLGAQVDLTSTGETALHAAVRSDAREAVSRLLELGADPNAPDVDGWTPLFSAQSRETVELLLNHGADPNCEDQCGERAAGWIKDPLISELLLR
jgi:ankyrin repeat protein